MKRQPTPTPSERPSRPQWVKEGNHTIIPPQAEPSTFPRESDDRRFDHLSPEGVPLQSDQQVMEAKHFVDGNHK